MKKKIILIVSIILIIGGILTGTYFYLNKQDDNTLTLLEKQWIQDNKNSRIDLQIENDIPIFSYDGEGLVYDFIESLENDTQLEFNKVSSNSSDSNYFIGVVDEVLKDDIVIYQDNYALITTVEGKYNNIDQMDNLIVGVLKDDLEQATLALPNSTITFVTADSYSDLITNLVASQVNAILLPKTMYLNQIIENNFNIAYNVSEMTKSIVIRLGDEKKLNNILIKYYQKWSKENFNEEFNNYFSTTYYNYIDIDDDTKVKFTSKRYKYGFVVNPPYDKLINNRLVGINSEIIKKFSELSGVEVTFTEYNSYAELIKAFNANKIDFFFNVSSEEKYEMDVIETASNFSEKVVVISHLDNDIIVNSIYSLKDSKVLAVNNTQITSYLKENNIDVKTYDNVEQLIKKAKDTDIIILDEDTYNIYVKDSLKLYQVDYTFKLPTEYNYVLRDISDNELFNKYFSFYTSFINEKEYFNSIDYRTFEKEEKLAFVKPLLYSLFAIIVLIVITIVIKKFKKHKTTVNSGVSKENKLKYIDILTSLKNRNYLNDSIEKWDASEVYPQAIIIADLNNIAYINDNYGHNEGDNVIKEAANILIKNQLEQSEIIRTNGNEFLIYLVGYEEKNIVSYIRKLSKEFKELEHGFGAALGYSMINDGLKTVDDAINEATLDMRANKEEAKS
jgi:diguanylate cyclase (GGDEF)-like protein